jgi:hypothetical protein
MRRQLYPNVGCDVAIFLNIPQFSPEWVHLMTNARRFAPFRVMRVRWGRSRQMRLADAQKEIYACGAAMRLQIGAFFQPRFGAFPVAELKFRKC